MRLKGSKHTYETEDLLGSGGFAQVYRAKVVEAPDSFVAIKVPHQYLPDPVKALFLREVDAAQKVASPHVVAILDSGDSPPFFAMELVKGSTLRALIEERRSQLRPWTEPELIALYLELCGGMDSINGH